MGNFEEIQKNFDIRMNYCRRDCFNFAIQLFTEAIKLALDNSEPYCNRGITYV